MKNARAKPIHPKSIEIVRSNEPKATRFTISLSFLWVRYYCRTVTDTYIYLVIFSRSCTKPFQFPIEQPLQQIWLFSIIGSVGFNASTVTLAIRVRILIQNLSKLWITLCKSKRPEQQPSGRNQKQLWNGWTIRCNRCSPNALVMNRAIGNNSYRTLVHESTGYTHIFLSTVKKSAFLLTACNPTRLISLQPTSMNTSWHDKPEFKRRTIWSEKHSISIEDAETPSTTERSMDPPIKSFEKFSLTTPLFQCVNHQNSLTTGKARMLFYIAVIMWLIEFGNSLRKNQLLLNVSNSNRSNSCHHLQTSPRVIG